MMTNESKAMSDLSEFCAWEDCDQEPVYCEGHAHELVNPLGYNICGQAAEIERLQAENERLRANAGAAYSQLMNLQPHIESCCLPGKQSYIDDHVDVAMKLLENEDE